MQEQLLGRVVVVVVCGLGGGGGDGGRYTVFMLSIHTG